MATKDRLLSDDELEKWLEQLHKCLSGEHQDWIADKCITVSDFIDLINTQKRLYAESVIGEDETGAKYSYLPPTLDELNKKSQEKAIRNELRAEQRSRLNDTK